MKRFAFLFGVTALSMSFAVGSPLASSRADGEGRSLWTKVDTILAMGDPDEREIAFWAKAFAMLEDSEESYLPMTCFSWTTKSLAPGALSGLAPARATHLTLSGLGAGDGAAKNGPYKVWTSGVYHKFTSKEMAEEGRTNLSSLGYVAGEVQPTTAAKNRR
jgi:hypothetical protein